MIRHLHLAHVQDFYRLRFEAAPERGVPYQLLVLFGDDIEAGWRKLSAIERARSMNDRLHRSVDDCSIYKNDQ